MLYEGRRQRRTSDRNRKYPAHENPSRRNGPFLGVALSRRGPFSARPFLGAALSRRGRWLSACFRSDLDKKHAETRKRAESAPITTVIRPRDGAHAGALHLWRDPSLMVARFCGMTPGQERRSQPTLLHGAGWLALLPVRTRTGRPERLFWPPSRGQTSGCRGRVGAGTSSHAARAGAAERWSSSSPERVTEATI